MWTLINKQGQFFEKIFKLLLVGLFWAAILSRTSGPSKTASMFVSAIMASLAGNIYTLAAAIAGLGLGSGIYRIRTVSVASQLFPAETRSLAISIATVGTPLGSALLPLLWRYLLGKILRLSRLL